LSQTYTAGSTFTIKFAAAAANADTLQWQIADYTGTAVASGSSSVPKGSSTVSLSCSSTLAGYFAVSAKLQNAGSTLPETGSRPAGIATFGVLPNVADLVPAAGAVLDRRRIGLPAAGQRESRQHFCTRPASPVSHGTQRLR
jgi:hypothetical protein